MARQIKRKEKTGAERDRKEKQGAGIEGDTATMVIKGLGMQFTTSKIFTETGYSQINIPSETR